MALIAVAFKQPNQTMWVWALASLGPVSIRTGAEAPVHKETPEQIHLFPLAPLRIPYAVLAFAIKVGVVIAVEKAVLALIAVASSYWRLQCSQITVQQFVSRRARSFPSLTSQSSR